jgi:hypothetical protein
MVGKFFEGHIYAVPIAAEVDAIRVRAKPFFHIYSDGANAALRAYNQWQPSGISLRCWRRRYRRGDPPAIDADVELLETNKESVSIFRVGVRLSPYSGNEKVVQHNVSSPQ